MSACFARIDNARITVIDYPPALGARRGSVPLILARPGVSMVCSLELVARRREIARFALRRAAALSYSAPQRPRAGTCIRMEKNLARYIWTHTRRQQIWILFIVLLSMPTYFMSFDLPKQIVNGPIQGDGFETRGRDADVPAPRVRPARLAQRVGPLRPVRRASASTASRC